jgi:lipoprotein-releasing system permease protein
MFKPFSLFVGMRYSLTRKHNLLLSFVSLISMLGISLGVLILIVALSVMSGSISALRDEALKSVPHVTLSSDELEDQLPRYLQLANTAEAIIAAAPYIEGEATLRYQGQNSFVRLRGIDPLLEAEVVNNQGQRYRQLLASLAATENGIILGAQLAGSLGIYTSGEVSAIALSSLLSRSLADSQGFEVVGFADFGVYSNGNIALINMPSARRLFQRDPGVDLQLRLRVGDVFEAEAIVASAFSTVSGVTLVPWNIAQASLFNALNMEKLLTAFMLLMIVIIGAVNIVSTLVMVVSDKGADIAILRTMGASRRTIMQVFITQGLIAGVMGTMVGAVLGVLLASNITAISLGLEHMINSIFVDANVYLISHLQTQVDWVEVVLVCVAALIISFLATLYPAYRASKIRPAEVLRYE